MTPVLEGLAWGILIVGIILIAEAYVLIGRQASLLGYGEQLLNAARQLLGQVPGKSAARTVAAVDAQPRTWLQRLRNLPSVPASDLERRHDAPSRVAPRARDTDPVVAERTGDDELARWADDGGSLGPPTVEDLWRAAMAPAPAPGTPPFDLLRDAGDVVSRLVNEAFPRERTPTVVQPAPDAADLALARFRFAAGHRHGLRPPGGT